MDLVNDIGGIINIDELVTKVLGFLPKLAIGVLIFLVFWALANAAERILAKVFIRRDLNRDVEKLVEQGVKLALMAVGIVTALGTMGIDVGALIASLGLAGFAIGFALKDAISNTLAGILLLVYRPFGRGDMINVAGSEGTVLAIDLRYTVLDTDAQRILVPNAQLFTNIVKVTKPRPEGSPEA